MADVDISQDLYNKIKREIDRECNNNKIIKGLLKKADKGYFTYIDAHNYATELGEITKKVFAKYLTADALPNGRLYKNISDKALSPILRENYNKINKVCEIAQTIMNEENKLNLTPQTPPISEEKLDNLLYYGHDAENFDKVKADFLNAVDNSIQQVVDLNVKENATFYNNAGIKTTIERISNGKCCKWCSELVGVYNYENAPKDIYRRHKNCKCIVIYKGDRFIENVHTKKGITFDEAEELQNNLLKAQEQNKRFTREGHPTNYELLNRMRKGKKDLKNQGFIAKNILNGEYKLKQRHQKYLQHVEDSTKWKEATRDRGEKQSYLTITEKEAQRIIYQHAGTGDIHIKNNSILSREYITLDNNIGKYYDKKKGEYIATKRAMILYSKKGTHIVPVEDVTK